MYDQITIMGCIKHERITINMLYFLKKYCHIPLLPPHNSEGCSQPKDLLAWANKFLGTNTNTTNTFSLIL